MKLNQKHKKAILLISQGLNGVAAAKEMSVTPETLSHWRQDFDFQAELNYLFKEQQNYQRDKLRTLNSKALDALSELIDDAENPRVRLAASLKILEVTKLKLSRVGSSNPEVLKKEKEQADLLSEYLL